MARDQALLKEAQIDLTRYQGLAAQNSIATQQVDNQQSLVHQYEGTVKADQAQVDMQQLNLTYAHISAPVSGRLMPSSSKAQMNPPPRYLLALITFQ